MKRSIMALMAVALGATAIMANEYTFVFDGDNDLGDIKRQTTINGDELTFYDEISLSEDGLDFSIKKESETGSGFALVNAGGYNAGIFIYCTFSTESAITPKVTLSAPGGKISAIKVYMSGSNNNVALNSLMFNINGKTVESVKDGNLYCWTWTDAKGAETLSWEWNNIYYSRYLHSIEVTYTADLGGKEECGLSFSETSAEAVMGQDYTLPVLSNPHNLPLEWKSSNEEVATIDEEGKLTLKGGGKTVITVSTPGNDAYARGNARYELNVVPVATDIPQLIEEAPAVYDRVYVDFPATVMFANGNFAYVTDAEGNAGCFRDIRNQGSTSTTVTTIYKVGDIIPAGWIATNATLYESKIWEGVPEKSTETTEVTYPEVESVTPADVDRVVILKYVTFTTATAFGTTKAYGKTPDGTTYEFQDTYNAPLSPAGTYDVTCVVKYSVVGKTEYFYLAPIAYTLNSGAGLNKVADENEDVRYYDLDGRIVTDPKSGIFIRVSGGNASKTMLK